MRPELPRRAPDGVLRGEKPAQLIVGPDITAACHWVSDAFFMCVPKGIPNDRLAVVLDIMAHVLTPKMQAVGLTPPQRRTVKRAIVTDDPDDDEEAIEILLNLLS